MGDIMEMFTKKAIMKILIGIGIGSIAGYAYYYFVGCQGGGCPLSSNWLSTTLFGAFFGFVMMFPDKNKAKKENDNKEN